MDLPIVGGFSRMVFFISLVLFTTGKKKYKQKPVSFGYYTT
ncbi:hypothetical protein ACQKL5_06875 [Peribacillus sp. NPDC097675]